MFFSLLSHIKSMDRILLYYSLTYTNVACIALHYYLFHSTKNRIEVNIYTNRKKEIDTPSIDISISKDKISDNEMSDLYLSDHDNTPIDIFNQSDESIEEIKFNNEADDLSQDPLKVSSDQNSLEFATEQVSIKHKSPTKSWWKPSS